jgi:hypothetical protein
LYIHAYIYDFSTDFILLIFIFAVGVGNKTDGAELVQISSGSEFVHTVNNGVDLSTLVPFIVVDACEKSNCSE